MLRIYVRTHISKKGDTKGNLFLEKKNRVCHSCKLSLKNEKHLPVIVLDMTNVDYNIAIYLLFNVTCRKTCVCNVCRCMRFEQL